MRFKQGQELVAEIENLVRENHIKAGYIITCVAGFSEVDCRMPGAKPDLQDIRTYEGDFELVSLVGTVSISGSHLHLSFSDKDGNVIGGHLKRGVVRMTAEIVIGVDEDKVFTRELDDETDFKELVVS